MAHEAHDNPGGKSGGGHRAHHGGHGGGGHEEAHEGAPEWLISFADNVALMMGFFVILLAMNMKPILEEAASPSGDETDPGKKARQVQNEILDFAIGVREAFNNPVSEDNPRDAALVRRLRERAAEAETKARGQRGTQHDVKSIRPTEYYGMGGTIAFDTGSVELTGAAREDLAELLRHRRGSRNVIEVRGHCSAAEAFDRPDRGMELSSQRALTVGRALVEAGIGWNQIRLIACADNDRVAQKTYDQLGHRANQRVEVIETPRAAGEDATPANQPVDEPIAPADRSPVH